MPFKIVRNDITKMQVDAIVNTANELPIYSEGTDTAIYQAAGVEELLAAREQIGFLDEGDVAITEGFQLPAKYIIHAVSPFYVDGQHDEAEKLRSCYEKSLQLALEYDCKSIAFPLIATGSYGYPKEEGMEIALSVIHSFLMKADMMVYLVVFDQESVRLSGQIVDDVKSYIDENYVVEKCLVEYSCTYAPSISFDKEAESIDYKRSLEDIVTNPAETFQQRLFRLIDERNRDEVEVYKRAGKDKKFFHKIRSNVNYQPSKHTVFAFALSLELSLDELKDLLMSAGFALSPSNRFDLIMQYVFEQKLYDIYKIDCILYDLGETHFFGCE